MRLAKLSDFRLLRGNAQNRQYAVIGLGRFGRAVCATLHKMGHDVLGIDSNEKLVNAALSDEMIAHALTLDATQPEALEEAGLFEFDVVVVAIGNFIQESIITTLNLKERGVKTVIAKASTEIHGRLLTRVGADQVIYPEHEMGCNLAYALTRPGILERLNLDVDHSIVEVQVPAAFNGQTLEALQLRSRYGVSVLAVGCGNRFEINPPPTLTLETGKLLVVIGSNTAIEALPG